LFVLSLFLRAALSALTSPSSKTVNTTPVSLRG
jgi:hypothetical protein